MPNLAILSGCALLSEHCHEYLYNTPVQNNLIVAVVNSDCRSLQLRYNPLIVFDCLILQKRYNGLRVLIIHVWVKMIFPIML